MDLDRENRLKAILNDTSRLLSREPLQTKSTYEESLDSYLPDSTLFKPASASPQKIKSPGQMGSQKSDEIMQLDETQHDREDKMRSILTDTSRLLGSDLVGSKAAFKDYSTLDRARHSPKDMELGGIDDVLGIEENSDVNRSRIDAFLGEKMTEDETKPILDTLAPDEKDAEINQHQSASDSEINELHNETERLLESTSRLVPMLKPMKKMKAKGASELANMLRSKGKKGTVVVNGLGRALRPVLTADTNPDIATSKGLKVVARSGRYGNEAVIARKRLLDSMKSDALRKRTEERQAERDRFEAVKAFDEDEGGFSDDEGKKKEAAMEREEEEEKEEEEEREEEEEHEEGWAARLAEKLAESRDGPFQRAIKQAAEEAEVLSDDELLTVEKDPSATKKLFARIDASNDIYSEGEEEVDFGDSEETEKIEEEKTKPEALKLELPRETSSFLPTPAMSQIDDVLSSEEEPVRAENGGEPLRLVLDTYVDLDEEEKEEEEKEEEKEKEEKEKEEKEKEEKANPGRIILDEAFEEDAEGNILYGQDKEEEKQLRQIEREEMIQHANMVASDNDSEANGDIDHDFNRIWNDAEDRQQTRKIMKQVVNGGWKNKYNGDNSDSDGPLQRKRLARKNRLMFGRKKRQRMVAPELSFGQKTEGDIVPIMAEALSDNEIKEPRGFGLSLSIPNLETELAEEGEAEMFSELAATPREVTESVTRTLIEAASQPHSTQDDDNNSISFYRPSSRMGTGAFKGKAIKDRPGSAKVVSARRKGGFFVSRPKNKENNTGPNSSLPVSQKSVNRKPFRRSVSKLSMALSQVQ